MRVPVRSKEADVGLKMVLDFVEDTPYKDDREKRWKHYFGEYSRRGHRLVRDGKFPPTKKKTKE